MDKPALCEWCGAETTDLRPYRVFYHYRKGKTQIGDPIQWLSPCCVREAIKGDSKWEVEEVERDGQ